MEAGKFLRSPGLASLLRFAMGGVLSSGIAIGTTALLHELADVREPIAAAVGFVLAMTVNFFMLRMFVFQGPQAPLLRQLLVFAGSSGVFRLFEYAAFFVMNVWLDVQYVVALVVVLGVSFLLKFFVFKRFVFRGTAPVSDARVDGDSLP